MSTEAPSIRNNPLDAVRCHSKSDIGQKREENQDSFGSAIAPDYKFYFVCDGMGGVKGGAVASQLAVSVIEKACKSQTSLDIEAIRTAVAEANSSIFDRGSNDEQLSGMGTTFVGLAFIDTKMLITSVGDSRAYRVRNGEITQLTEDHTLVMELLRSGSITEEQAINHPVSHMLTRSLGPAPEIEIDCWESIEAPQPGDKYLLCSDGLYNMLGLEELGEVILSLPPEEAVEELVSLANLRGGHDNITVMLITLDETYPQPEAPAEVVPGPDRLSDDDEDKVPHTPAQEPGFTLKAPEEVVAPQKTGPAASKSDKTTDGSKAASKTGARIREQAAAAGDASAAATTAQSRVSRPRSDEHAQTAATQAQTRASSGGPRNQAKFFIIALAGLAGAYLLGHLHGATDEDAVVAHRMTDRQGVEAKGGEEDHPPIAVAPVAIQPVEEPVRAPAVVAETTAPTERPAEAEESAARAPTLLDHQSEDRRQELERMIAEFENKLAAFKGPISGKAGEMLKASTAQIERISHDLDSTRAQIDSATRALTIWLGRKKRLQTGDPINLASEVSISSELVKSKQDAFNQVTYAFLQENEVLRFNPGDKARERRVADLARQRLTAMRELIDSVKVAIQEELSKVEKQIESSTLARVDLESQLEEARRDVEYVKALAGSDVKAREAKQLELQRLLDVARAELEEISRSQP